MPRRRLNSGRASKPNEFRFGILLIIAIAVIALSFYGSNFAGFSVAGSGALNLENPMIITPPENTLPPENPITGTAGGQESGQELSSSDYEIQAGSCTSTITACCNLDGAGTFTLTNNISNSATTPCILISVSDVILNGNGKTIDGQDAGGSVGVQAFYSGGTDLITNITVRNLVVTDWATGIEFNTVNSGSIQNCTAQSNAIGISMIASDSNTIFSNTISTSTSIGFKTDATSDSNVFTNNTAFKNVQDVYITDGGLSNTFTNQTFTSTRTNFTYYPWSSYDLKLNSTASPTTDPAGYVNISKYVTITKYSPAGFEEQAGAVPWLALYEFYDDSDINGATESNLTIAKDNGTWYPNHVFASDYSVNKALNFVYSNITDAGSTYAPLGATLITDVTTCRDINSTGAYTLSADLTDYQTGGLSGGTCATRCMSISASNVILDCNHHNITTATSGTSCGIYALPALTNITVKNCNVTGYATGIYYNDIDWSAITNNVLYWNPTPGGGDASAIHLASSDYVNVTNNIARSNDYGVYLNTSTNNNISGNTFNNNTNTGIYLTTSSYNNITNNTLNNNTNCSISFAATSTYNKVISNNMSNSGYGVYITAASCSNNNFTSNYLSGNTNYEFYAYSGILWNTIAVNNVFAGKYGLTTATFSVYNGNFGLGLKAPTSLSTDPTGYSNISKYIRVSGITIAGMGLSAPLADPWLFMNISYTDGDLGVVNESILAMAKDNGTWETTASRFSSSNGIDTTNNIVYANITNLNTSTFVPIGNIVQPQLSPVVVDASADSVVVNWLTDGNADSEVAYGLNDSLAAFEYNATLDTNHNVTVSSLNAGTSYYYVAVSCNIYGYCNATELDNFTTTSTVVVPPTGGAPGGGGPTTPTTETLGGIIVGTSQDIALSVGSTTSFISGGVTHSVRVSGVFDSTVEITISSNPIKATFKVGETKDFDTNSNGINDLEVTLLSKTDNTANLRIKVLSEIPTPTPAPAPAAAAAAACGNGICESGETITICPIDCAGQIATSTAMFFVQQGSVMTFAILIFVLAILYAIYNRRKHAKCKAA